MEDLAVEVRNVSFAYDGHPVLRDVNLEIRKGEFLAVMGPNGGGKTTLLKILLGILKPAKGSVLLFGKHPGEMAHKIGYVPQDTNINKEFPISVMDVTLMGRLAALGSGWRYSATDRLLARQALERVKMWDYRHRPVGRLSGGQRQRVFIARALAANLCFINRWPASTRNSRELFEFLKELNTSMTIVVVSHDMAVLSSYVKSVACLNQTLYYHDAAEITDEMMEMAYHCPVELVAHGMPHRVLRRHED